MLHHFEVGLHYHAAPTSRDAQLVDRGLCPGCLKTRKRVKDLLGNVRMVQDCQYCHVIKNNKKDISLWIICGPAGSGKTTIFNSLTGESRGTSDGFETMTLNAQALKDYISPANCYISGKSNLFFCDSEGTNGVIMSENRDESANRFVSMIKNALLRYNCGVTGIVLCIDYPNKRFDQNTKAFLEFLAEALKHDGHVMSIILCFTKCNLLPNRGDVILNANLWFNSKEQEGTKKWLQSLNNGQNVAVACTWMGIDGRPQEMYLSNLLDKVSEQSGVRKNANYSGPPPTIDVKCENLQSLEKKAIATTMYIHERNPVLATLFGTNERVLLSTICSPLLLAFSPLIVPAFLVCEYNRAVKVKK